MALILRCSSLCLARLSREESAHLVHSGDSVRLIDDRVFDSDPLDARLQAAGIAMIALHRSNRTNPETQDGRSLRAIAPLESAAVVGVIDFRRILVRYDRHARNSLRFVHLGCLVILLRTFFG